MDIQKIEQKLWAAADKLRNNMDAAEYKHVVLGLIFLKYISDAFEEKHAELSKIPHADPEDKDEYSGENIFWVPKEARWTFLKDNAKQPNIGVLIDEAMDAIERDNPSLKGVLSKEYAKERLDKRRLGELIDQFSNISFGNKYESKDILGRIYEYFMGMFADAEGKRGGQFYTPRSIVNLLVTMLAPHPGARIYDPCCGSGGMFVQSERFIEDHAGRIGDIAVYGQESNQTTWKLAKMNMAIHGIGADIQYGDTLHNDKLPDLKADFVIANPPFNVSDWGGETLRNDTRWKFGAPPVGNANFAWVQHFIHHLSPKGTAGFVLANGSMSSQSSGEGEIRKKIVEADLVDCIVTLPAQLFFNTGIPACLWFISRDKSNRKGETLFIDARNLGTMINRRNKELTIEDIAKIADVYHQWKAKDAKYEDIAGFCKVATLDEIKDHDYVITPGSYAGSADIEEDNEIFEEKTKKILIMLKKQFDIFTKEERQLEANLDEALAHIGNSGFLRWQTGKLKDLAEVTTGKGSTRSKIKEEGQFPLYGANGVMGYTNDYLFDEDLILTGRVGTLGKVRTITGKAWVSDNVLIIKPKKGYFGYVYCVLKTIDFQNLNRGSTQPLVTQTDLKNQTIFIPVLGDIEAFEDMFAGLSRLADGHERYLNILHNLRDSLLPRLISGKGKV